MVLGWRAEQTGRAPWAAGRLVTTIRAPVVVAGWGGAGGLCGSIMDRDGGVDEGDLIIVDRRWVGVGLDASG